MWFVRIVVFALVPRLFLPPPPLVSIPQTNDTNRKKKWKGNLTGVLPLKERKKESRKEKMRGT